METEINKELSSENQEAIQKGNPLGWGKLALFLTAFIGFSFILVMVLTFILGIMDGMNGSNRLDELLNQSHYLLLLDAAAFLLAILLFKSVRQFLKGAFSFKAMKQGKTYLYLFVGFIVLFAIEYLIMEVFHWEDGSDQIDTFGIDKVSTQWLSMILFYLAFTIITPIKEEILFRGILHGFLSDKIHFWVGLLVSSLIFGSLHVGHILSAAIMGIVLVLLYKLTKSLVVPIVFHIIWNMYAITGLFLFLQSAG